MNSIFEIESQQQFNEAALEIFRYQAINNEVYRQYLELIRTDIEKVRQIEEIPFLPIEFFKSHIVKTISPNSVEADDSTIVFTSSGTTGQQTSNHYVSDISIYEKSFTKAFELFYGNPKDYSIIAILPNYQERTGSSLIYMVKQLMKTSNHFDNKFYLHNLDDLAVNLIKLEHQKQKTLLIGVTYSLLNLVDLYKFNLKNTIVMETGGMKGRRKEMIREDLHAHLSERFGVETIHSEYGMTELLSQAYSQGGGRFYTPPWMKVLIREPNDPFTILEPNRTGGINVIDLANINSCSFIETKDLGKRNNDGSFEVLGRLDNSDIRGCNLLV